jgi:hypothetical protein
MDILGWRLAREGHRIGVTDSQRLAPTEFVCTLPF